MLIRKKLQDAYALCRVFKKSLNAVKIGDHYGSDRSGCSINDQLYTEDSDYGMPTTASSSMLHHASLPLTDDNKWMQYLSDEPNFTCNNNPTNAPFPYNHPSKVNSISKLPSFLYLMHLFSMQEIIYFRTCEIFEKSSFFKVRIMMV